MEPWTSTPLRQAPALAVRKGGTRHRLLMR